MVAFNSQKQVSVFTVRGSKGRMAARGTELAET